MSILIYSYFPTNVALNIFVLVFRPQNCICHTPPFNKKKQCFEDWEENYYLVTERIKDKGVCRPSYTGSINY